MNELPPNVSIVNGKVLLAAGRPPIERDLILKNGKIHAVVEPGQAPSRLPRFDVKGMLVSPPFVESHVHLDSALVDAGRCINESGTLFEGIERWREIKKTETVESIMKRAQRALRLQAEQGVLFVRSHADVSHEKLFPLTALVKLREKVKAWTTLQVVAFPQDGFFGSDKQPGMMEKSIKQGADVVGGIPHYELTREDGVESIARIFALAKKYNRMIDVHCDEIDDSASRFLEVMAAHAIRNKNGPRVTASHTTAFGSYEGGYALKLMGFLKRAKINFVANPLINIVLQGRADDYPKRRGLTRVKELWQAGLNISLGYDCIQDPWYALGTGNMLDAAHMAVHVCQMMGKAEIDACYDMVTFNGAKTLGIEAQYGLEPGKPASFVVLDVENRFEAVQKRPKPAHVISRGQLLF